MDGTLRHSLEKEFRIKEIQFNPRYQVTNPLEHAKLSRELHDYYREGARGVWKRTPSFAYGLGGTLLPVPSDQPEFISLQPPKFPIMDDSVL